MPSPGARALRLRDTQPIPIVGLPAEFATQVLARVQRPPANTVFRLLTGPTVRAGELPPCGLGIHDPTEERVVAATVLSVLWRYGVLRRHGMLGAKQCGKRAVTGNTWGAPRTARSALAGPSLLSLDGLSRLGAVCPVLEARDRC